MGAMRQTKTKKQSQLIRAATLYHMRKTQKSNFMTHMTKKKKLNHSTVAKYVSGTFHEQQASTLLQINRLK